MNKIEILAPAGGSDSIAAAVKSGADAVYFGAKSFSARSSAKNFSDEELKAAIRYCRIRDVKTYLTVNTLILDNELHDALDLIINAASAGIDAVIVQDIGLASLIKQAIPGLALHASTQMTVHTPAGAEKLYEIGFKRAVLARELSRQEILEIRKSSPIELEVFVHGALCMCVSGQCFFSSMLGARSGNRGRCAQPCRLPFSVAGENGHALSLKDNSLIKYISDLQDIGITSAKIEGRMKRPEYVAASVSACREARDLGSVSDKTMKRLADIFSRTGFTDGYYSSNRGGEMFGYRRYDDVAAADEKLFAGIRNEYKDEPQKIGVDFTLNVRTGEPPSLTVSDGKNTVTSVGSEAVQRAMTRPADIEFCEKQLAKTGGTPYYLNSLAANIDPSANISASVLNFLRRNSLDELSELRSRPPQIKLNKITIPAEGFQPAPTEFRRRIRVSECRNLGIFDDFDMIIIPLFSDDEAVNALLKRGLTVAVEIPRVMFGAEGRVKKRLFETKALGINHAVVHNIGALSLSAEAEFTMHGGYGLNITNTASVLWAKEAGLSDVELSFELSLAQIRHIGGDIPLGVTSLGRLPLMITRNCPNHSAGRSCRTCGGEGTLTDRKGIRFPFSCDGISTQIYNSLPVLLAEKPETDFEIYSLSGRELKQAEKANSAEELKKIIAEEKITNGLYYRGLK